MSQPQRIQRSDPKPSSERPTRRASFWKKAGTIGSPILAGLALLVSGLAVREQRKSLHEERRLAYDTSTQQIIHDQYELCRVLDQLRVEHPEISHMLALPSQDPSTPTWASYELFKRKVRSAFNTRSPISASERDKLYLQEHAVALHVFDIYEQTVIQWQAASEAGDKERAGILKMLVDYYEGRMLRNPRLRYHWNHGGSDMLEKATRARYSATVLDKKKFPSDWTDQTSPIG